MKQEIRLFFIVMLTLLCLTVLLCGTALAEARTLQIWG